MANRTYQYEGAKFQVARTSSASATVALQCGMHEHEPFIVGLMEDEARGWVVGRKKAGYPQDGHFGNAVDHAAELLVEECNALVQVDMFFSGSE